jgi:hypothetical protein
VLQTRGNQIKCEFAKANQPTNKLPEKCTRERRKTKHEEKKKSVFVATPTK